MAFIPLTQTAIILRQSDYGYVHLRMCRQQLAYGGKDLYLFGELTNYKVDDASRMVFNAEKGAYEGTLFLKQGYYNYTYVSVDAGKNWQSFSFANTEGNLILRRIITLCWYITGHSAQGLMS
jgi:hypothetical protein